MGNSGSGRYGDGEAFYARPLKRGRAVPQDGVSPKVIVRPPVTLRSLRRAMETPATRATLERVARASGLDEAEVALLGSDDVERRARVAQDLIAKDRTRGAADRLLARSRILERVRRMDAAELSQMEDDRTTGS